jgi:hypothetical protein
LFNRKQIFHFVVVFALFTIMLAIHLTKDATMTIRHEITLLMIQIPSIWPTELGMAVANDRGLYRQVCNGRKPRALMIDRIRAYITAKRDDHGLHHVAPADALDTLFLYGRSISVANNN